jgi:hypothetical protein
MGWNLKEAARECGLPAATWRLWEEGAAPRNLVTICMAIRSRTGVDLDWLLRGPSATTLRERADHTGWYLTDVLDPPPHPATTERVLVRHGDGRRKPQGRTALSRSSRVTAINGSKSRPVSRSALA